MNGPTTEVRWTPMGTAALSGAVADLRDDVDRSLLRIAVDLGATDRRFPPVIDAQILDRVDYFASFPHLATFAACLDDAEVNLQRFRHEPLARDGSVALTCLAPVRAVLNPAACFHVYSHHADAELDSPVVDTTRATCFRREASYRPLERQWCFDMREIVCLGTRREVRELLAEARAAVDELRRRLDLPCQWAHATDPFFRAAANPKHLMQRVDPVKHELVFDGRLAVASTNVHYDAFGSAFGIRRVTDEGSAVADSGCIAFGLERWVAAILDRHGNDPANWPDLSTTAVTP